MERPLEAREPGAAIVMSLLFGYFSARETFSHPVLAATASSLVVCSPLDYFY